MEIMWMFVNSLARQLTKLMPRKLFGSQGSPRLKTGTITAIDHASGNSPEIKTMIVKWNF
jgi:hypothetical protein